MTQSNRCLDTGGGGTDLNRLEQCNIIVNIPDKNSQHSDKYMFCGGLLAMPGKHCGQ